MPAKASAHRKELSCEPGLMSRPALLPSAAPSPLLQPPAPSLFCPVPQSPIRSPTVHLSWRMAATRPPTCCRTRGWSGRGGSHEWSDRCGGGVPACAGRQRARICCCMHAVRVSVCPASALLAWGSHGAADHLAACPAVLQDSVKGVRRTAALLIIGDEILSAKVGGRLALQRKTGVWTALCPPRLPCGHTQHGSRFGSKPLHSAAINLGALSSPAHAPPEYRSRMSTLASCVPSFAPSAGGCARQVWVCQVGSGRAGQGRGASLLQAGTIAGVCWAHSCWTTPRTSLP